MRNRRAPIDGLFKRVAGLSKKRRPARGLGFLNAQKNKFAFSNMYDKVRIASFRDVGNWTDMDT